MQDIKNRVEAILFTTGRYVDINELSELTGIASKGSLKEAISSLINDYHDRDGSLEIHEEGEKFKLNIKKEYLHVTTQLLDQTDFDKPTQETLALIAYRQPVIQSDIVKLRGNTAYDHISKLKEMDFVVSEKFGRTRLLKTTQKFYDYFDVVGAELKQKLENIQNEKQIS